LHEKSTKSYFLKKIPNAIAPIHPLDKFHLYAYTYIMSDRILPTHLVKANRVPANCMGWHIRRASRILTQIYDTALRPVGLVLNQFTLLVAIHLVESTSITRLAEELFVDQTTLTRNLKILEKRRLVAIAPGADRRVKLVSLTDEGRTVLAQALPLWEKAQTEASEQFGSQKWEALLSLLSDLKALG
jgi:DNA-binding MarR family transcriptional regulator